MSQVTFLAELALMKLQAPVSLASSLQEYLDDPNFEQNRIEYKASNANANRNKDRSSTQSALPGGIVCQLNTL